MREGDKNVGMLLSPKIMIPKGSKETSITGETFNTVVLDATPTPKDKATDDNWGGGLSFHSTGMGGAGMVVVDSLSAMNDGAVEFYTPNVTEIKKMLSSVLPGSM